MEIKKGKTHSGEQTIKFVDQTDSNISLRIEEHSKQGKGTKLLYLDTDDDYFKFTQEDIKTLLPYLQSFAETGELEPQESTLQGGMISVDFVKSVIERYMNDHDAFDACEAILQDLALPETKHVPTLQKEESQLIYAAVINDPSKRVLTLKKMFKEQEERIEALEMLVREWKKFGQDSWQSQHPSALVKQTDQLLGE